MEKLRELSAKRQAERERREFEAAEARRLLEIERAFAEKRVVDVVPADTRYVRVNLLYSQTAYFVLVIVQHTKKSKPTALIYRPLLV